jgi:hypothetical protein
MKPWRVEAAKLLEVTWYHTSVLEIQLLLAPVYSSFDKYTLDLSGQRNIGQHWERRVFVWSAHNKDFCDLGISDRSLSPAFRTAVGPLGWGVEPVVHVSCCLVALTIVLLFIK